ncbi:hypothetical protein FB45DRAFT_914065 [Roridomyces roridus]|uniref:Nudix hydrolase domain-containing protein n=1 Tax=Roridomyces roridus TaxID=1738132 RepID=A0AAD7BXA4_9AGAR|nr:hypothetical protein FB45DRAFT_914065 [Roridomyces roridus]
MNSISGILAFLSRGTRASACLSRRNISPSRCLILHSPSSLMSTCAKSTVVPRPSASCVIINSKNEVLLVHRNPQARSFAGVHVFPGGNDSAQDGGDRRITAIRETFEESGLLLASGPTPSDTILDAGRQAIHAGKTKFHAFLAEHGLTADVQALLPFTQWITPVGPPRRFHTHFFITFLGGASSSGFTSGAKEDRIPKPDGGQEVIAARFVRPEAVIAEFRVGKITLMPPQFYILTTLSSILKGDATTREERARVEELARGAFGRMVINPRQLPGAPDAEGRYVLTYETDEARGGPQGRLHRAVVRSGKGGVTHEITLHRNFDIFTEVDVGASSKL